MDEVAQLRIETGDVETGARQMIGSIRGKDETNAVEERKIVSVGMRQNRAIERRYRIGFMNVQGLTVAK